MIFSNPMMPSFLAAPQPNVMAVVQQQQGHQMQMMWPMTDANAQGPSFPIPMSQLSSSNLAPPATGMTNSMLPANLVAVSDPPSVSTKGSGAKIPAARKSKVKPSAKKNAQIADLSASISSNGMDSDDGKVQQSRERNREHARSTRIRKKAYIQKLKDMANGLRTVQTEEIRQRRSSMQKLLDIQKIRRAVVHTVLQYHANFESDASKWSVLLEDSFWLKQPVTPFRSFRRSEVDRVRISRSKDGDCVLRNQNDCLTLSLFSFHIVQSQDCRILRGTVAFLCDAASLAVMLERAGCYNKRWQRIKRSGFVDEDFVNKEISAGQAPESSLSSGSSSDSSSTSRTFKRGSKKSRKNQEATTETDGRGESKGIVSSSSDASKKETDGAKNNKKRGQETLSSTSKPTSSSSNVASGSRTPSTKRRRMSPPQVAGAISIQSITSATSQPYPIQALSSYNLNLVNQNQRTSAKYYMNEDDMIMIEDVMMCPYVFRTSHAVECGALAEVIVPGMLRVQFSPNNKLLNMELVFDAMGFMQQLDGANGGNITAQVVPGSLEMALMHSSHEARAITQATPPYSILHVNEMWTNLTKHSQVDVEGKALLPLLEGSDENEKQTGPFWAVLDDAAKGRPRFFTGVHYRKSGHPFVDFMCTYPLTK